LTRLDPDSLAQAGESLCSIVSDLKTESFVTRQTAAIHGALGLPRVISNTVRTSDKTETIGALDDEIDELLLVFISNLESAIKNTRFEPKKAEAAKPLLAIVQKRNRQNLIHGGYIPQGEEIRTLFDDILKPELKELRETAGVEPVLAIIKNNFDQLSTLLDARAGEGNLPTTQKEQRRILRYRIDKLLSFLDANITDNVDGYAPLKDKVNGFITDLMAKVDAAKTRKESAETAVPVAQ